MPPQNRYQIPSLGQLMPDFTTPPFMSGQSGEVHYYALLAQINQILSAPPVPTPDFTPNYGCGWPGAFTGILASLPPSVGV